MKPLKNIREALKTVKHSKPQLIFCPRCASPNLKLSSSLDYWLTPKNYYCPDCGYHGIVYMELEKEEEKEETRPNQATQDSAASSESYTDSAP